MKEKVVIGMSGGVDSSVCAYLLKEQGYDVIGVTMHTWEGCDAQIDAKKVADQLGIKHYEIDFSNEFKNNVIDNFCTEYLSGHTPNPCVVCNRFVKFEALLSKAKEFGADYIATGHYASIEKLDNGRYSLKCAASNKDQTYALYRLTQDQLAHIIMPLGKYEKKEIRQIAEEANLVVAHKSDSQEVCFIPDNDYAGFIERYTGQKIQEGSFIDIKGNVLGKHKGIIHYTIGQRKGLGLSMGKPVFVSEIRPDTNEVVIGYNEDILKTTLYADKINFMSQKDITQTRALAKIRYNHVGDMCTVKKVSEDMIECTFDRPQRAVTPGQAVVLYDGDYVLGGGTIL